MNGTDWAERLEALADREDAHLFDVRDDVARGRSRLLRNRVGVAAAATLVGVVVLGTGHADPGAQQSRAAPCDVVADVEQVRVLAVGEGLEPLGPVGVVHRPCLSS